MKKNASLIFETLSALEKKREESIKAHKKAVIKKNNTMRTYSFDSCDAANEFLSRFVCRGDGILVKGSRGMHTDEIVEYIKNMEI